MAGKDLKKLIASWIESSDRDFKTMSNMFKTKDYSWSLFVGHLVIEKLLKAYYIKTMLKTPPFSHNLQFIAASSGLELSETHLKILETVTAFNMHARYDNEKRIFYLKCNKEFTGKWIAEIKLFRTWIKERL
jgi:HEPN domain-containing protein